MQFTLPEPVLRKAEQHARDRGYSSVGDYVSEHVEQDEPSPFIGRKAEVEAALIAGLESGSNAPMTRADWDELKRRVPEVHSKKPAHS